MIKTAIQLLIALAMLNAAARGAMAAWTYYQLKDEAQQLITFGAGASTQDLHNQILEKAAELELPVEPHNVTVRRKGPQTFAGASYTQSVELAPGFVYPVNLSFAVDSIAVRPMTSDDLAP